MRLHAVTRQAGSQARSQRQPHIAAGSVTHSVQLSPTRARCPRRGNRCQDEPLKGAARDRTRSCEHRNAVANGGIVQRTEHILYVRQHCSWLAHRMRGGRAPKQSGILHPYAQIEIEAFRPVANALGGMLAGSPDHGHGPSPLTVETVAARRTLDWALSFGRWPLAQMIEIRRKPYGTLPMCC